MAEDPTQAFDTDNDEPDLPVPTERKGRTRGTGSAANLPSVRPTIDDPEEEIDFRPDDISARRQLLTQTIQEAKRRHYTFDLERMSKEITRDTAAGGKLRATTLFASANDQVKPQLEQRIAQILIEQEGIENEIRVCTRELRKLGTS
jgi:hypothetical protein